MSAAFVLDASLALAWCFPDEETPEARRVYDALKESEAVAVVPAWFFIELANVLAISERKGRIRAEKAEGFIRIIEGLDLDVDHEAEARAFTHLLPLCRRYKLTAYDAIYLDLAHRARLPLATLDKNVRKAARKMGVKILR